MSLKLSDPISQVKEGLSVGDVKHEEEPHGISVEGSCQTSVSTVDKVNPQ